MDKVVIHWVSLVEGVTGGTYRWGRGVLYCTDFFYTDDIMVASTDPEWIQGVFNTLTGLFDRVGLRNNVGKTVGMLCRPFCVVGTHLEALYMQ